MTAAPEAHVLGLSRRDVEALVFIGEGYEVAQYELHEAVFRSRAPNVVSRFVVRVERLRLIVAERLHGFGVNRLRLTAAGAAHLGSHGIPCERLFVPRRAVALKDLAHTTWINDLRVAFMGLPQPPDVIHLAWQLARESAGMSPTIPDLLAVWRSAVNRIALTFACEVDLGAEPLADVFLPKLDRLCHDLRSHAEGERAVLVFTKGTRRLRRIEERRESFPLPLLPFLLPDETGPSAIAALRGLIRSD